MPNEQRMHDLGAEHVRGAAHYPRNTQLHFRNSRSPLRTTGPDLRGTGGQAARSLE